MQTMIHEYIRERIPGRGKQIVGVIVGTTAGKRIVIGFSKANIKEGDTFDKEFGIDLALNRARGLEPSPEIPPQVVSQYRDFQRRCLRYFKQALFVNQTNDCLIEDCERLFNNLLSCCNGKHSPFNGILFDSVY
jgi:hypothetical protein